MDDFAQPAAEPTELSLLSDQAGGGGLIGSCVEQSDGRLYIGSHGNGRLGTVADLAWGRALRQLQAGHLPPVAEIDRALASLVIARTEPGEAPATAARRLVATGDLAFGALCAGRLQACQGGSGPP